MIIYNKLVRDKIPEVIQAAGKTCTIEKISDNQKVISLLEEKFLEEWVEYQEAKNVEEIADLIEVLLSLSERLGTSRDDLMKIIDQKAEKRGGFKEGIFLVSVD